MSWKVRVRVQAKAQARSYRLEVREVSAEGFLLRSMNTGLSKSLSMSPYTKSSPL